jgi:hypothetical protein
MLSLCANRPLNWPLVFQETAPANSFALALLHIVWHVAGNAEIVLVVWGCGVMESGSEYTVDLHNTNAYGCSHPLVGAAGYCFKTVVAESSKLCSTLSTPQIEDGHYPCHIEREHRLL